MKMVCKQNGLSKFSHFLILEKMLISLTISQRHSQRIDFQNISTKAIYSELQTMNLVPPFHVSNGNALDVGMLI